jgi:(p)ppGpp synthase/HD superfamily hydrolase
MVGDPRLSDALRLAAKLHDGQWREGDAPLPYACHVAEVVSLLRWTGGITDPDVLCAGFLHDTVEDCGYSVKRIAKRFGGRVADLVRQVTRAEPPEEQVAGLSNDDRFLVRNRLFMEEISRMDRDAKCIKLADRLSNLREAELTGDGTLRRYTWQTRRILEAIDREANPALHDELSALAARLTARFPADGSRWNG